jgi:hypothetical protein
LGILLLDLAWSLFRYDKYNGLLVYAAPLMLSFGVATGLPSGLLIWAGSRAAKRTLHFVNRSALGVLVVAVAWFFYWLLCIQETPTGEAQLWLAESIIVPGVTIGLVTGSRLRLWRELVRAGEANGSVLRILAGFTGTILRISVVFLFVNWLFGLISALQVHYQISEYPLSALVWPALFFVHFALCVVVLFARLKLPVLALLTAVAMTPVAATLWVTDIPKLELYFVLSYLALWAVFLLTRWGQTQVALSVLKEELRYYLID